MTTLKLMLLRILLFALGHGLALASRIVPSIRSQITRDLTFEISTEDGVARQWYFNGQQRRIATQAGQARPSTNAVRFPSSEAALKTLLSPHLMGSIVDGILRGTIRIQGALFAVYWFWGLTRKIIAIGPEIGPCGMLPGAYTRHDPRSNGAEQIIIEPAVNRLDPKWVNAWTQRAKLLMIRVTTGEPMQKV